MKAENRDLIDPKLRKKIENLVRKSAGGTRSGSAEGEAGGVSACPFCQEDISDMELTCMVCKNEIPFCIATGHHICKNDITFCPHCDFPAFTQPLGRLLTADPACPMCSSELRPDSLINGSGDVVEQYLSRSKHAD